MRRIIIISLLLFTTTLSFSQESWLIKRIDSLVAIPNYGDAEKLIISQANTSDLKKSIILFNRLAEIQITQGKLDQAEETIDKWISTKKTDDPFLKAITETNIGFIQLNRSRNDLALENLQDALALFQKAGQRDTEEAAKCLSYLSLLYWSVGKLNQAEDNGLIALQIRQKLKGETSEEVAASYNDLGLVYGQTDSDKALEYYEKALAVYEKMHGDEHPKIAIANTNIGFIYNKMKLYGDAVNNFENAESIWKKIYPEGHPNQALALFNLGLTYGQMGNKKASLEYYEKSLALYKKAYGEKHPDISIVLNEIGLLKYNEAKYDEALQSFQDALCANIPNFNNRSIAVNPRINNYYRGKILLYSLRLKAQALEAKHFGKTLRLTELTSALSCLYSCDSLIDDIRFHSSDENDKIELGSSANEVYEDGVRVAHAMSEMTINFKQYEQAAFYFAEKSKSAVLQESIADAEAKSFAGIPEALLDEEKTLKASIATLTQKLSQKPSVEEEKLLRESLFNLNQKYETFTKQLEKNYPDYFDLKYNQTTPSIADIQKILDNKTAIVCYFIAEKNQRLYSFIISKSKFRIYNSTMPSDFDRLIKGFNNSLYFSVADSYSRISNQLSKLLLRGISPGYKDIVIIPGGRLGTMPFEALSTSKIIEHQSYSTIDYLAKKYSISYEFSAGLLLQKSRSSKQSQPSSIFLCAPITFPVKDNLDDLPGTEKEVSNIAQLFASTAMIAKGTDANESLIKSGKLSEYRYLHFATHGIVDEESPELSRIYLQSAPSEDGNVFSGEIFNLKLNADLTVLSACQTGLGKFSKGEGVIGLSRALVYAGAKNIMVSYWSVSDESTSELMTSFYEKLLAQSSPNFREALQQAKTEMIKKSTYAAPYYWAPFVLIGF
ncbi:MAG: CHAT domain-containing protein [Cyclobacteriaceae bacterium]|nr:CHAT domain-containing protein [Cyclobacteriaceae bacterium]